jgi:hypothetical protein
MPTSQIGWLRSIAAEYRFEPIGILRRSDTGTWPIVVNSDAELEQTLRARGRLLPLPTEPAALANVVEVSLVNFVLERAAALPGAIAAKGSERGYPDVELSGPAFGGGFCAVDVKVARRAKNKERTQSPITLYTGNTYFKHPALRWPGTLRPFQEYSAHLDLLAIYTFSDSGASRISDLELIVQEPWRIASRQRSSSTREYIGAVTSIDDLRNGNGEFATEKEFYDFWRKFHFKIGRAVEMQLKKLIAEKGKDSAT